MEERELKELSLWTSDAIELMMAGAAEGTVRPGRQKKMEKKNRIRHKLDTNDKNQLSGILPKSSYHTIHAYTHRKNDQQMTIP